MIDKDFPEPKTLIDNEIETLEELKDDPFLYENYSKLATDANAAYSKAIHSKNFFDFESSFKVLLDGKPGMAFVGGTVTSDKHRKSYDIVSYHLSICKAEEEESVLLRKLHFDYTKPTSSHRQPHPVFHLQQPGNLTPCLKAAGLSVEHLHPWLSEPRLPYRPMSIALLINLVFKEFPDETSHKCIERSEWRRLVRKNEELLLDPYYEQCYQFVEKRRKGVIKGVKHLLTNDFFYGNYKQD